MQKNAEFGLCLQNFADFRKIRKNMFLPLICNLEFSYVTAELQNENFRQNRAPDINISKS